MENIKYLSIAEFAEAAGVSKQAIYKQINNENSQLAPYILRDGKKISISAAALSALYEVDSSGVNLSTTKVEKKSTVSTHKSTPEVDFSTQNSTSKVENSTPENQPISTDYIEFLKAEIAELKTDKIQTERRLNATIKEKDEIIKQQNEQLAGLAQQVADIAAKALITTSQQQYLAAAEKVDKQEVEEIIINKPEAKKPKKRIWTKIFRR